MSISNPALWFFKGLALQRKVPASAWGMLIDEGRTERWGHSAQVFVEDGQSYVYVIVKGGVSFQESPGRVLMGAGDVFGSIASSDAAPLLYARDDTTLLGFTQQQFDGLVGAHLGEMQVKSPQLNRTNGRRLRFSIPISPLFYSSPVSRLAKVLIHIGQEHMSTSTGEATLRLPVESKRFMARLTGLDPARAMGVVRQFQSRGLLKKGARGKVVLTDLEELRLIANS